MLVNKIKKLFNPLLYKSEVLKNKFMNTNEIYDYDFKNAILNYKTINPHTAVSKLKSYNYNPSLQAIDSISRNNIQFCNDYIFDNYRFPQSNGLCAYLCSIGFQSFVLSSNLTTGFLTIGKILVKNQNMFNVPDQSVLIDKIKKDQIEEGFSIIGSNLHTWITLENGEIVDPSIIHTLNGTRDIVIDTPKNLFEKFNFRYIPYSIVDTSDLTELLENNLLGKSYEDTCKKSIRENINNLNFMQERISNYY